MNEQATLNPIKGSVKIRWWPLLIIFFLALAALGHIVFFEEVPRQEKYLRAFKVLFFTMALFLVWLICFSRLPWKQRWGIFALVFLTGITLGSLFKIGGVSGDLLPIIEFRWKPKRVVQPAQIVIPAANAATATMAPREDASFPQFGGPNRNAVLSTPRIDPDWSAHPPKELWRKETGPAWAGFAVRFPYAITQEQRGDSESVVCYDVESGKVLWSHADPAKYATVIAGEGPRSTPTIAGTKVVTMGATGFLNCLDLESGKVIWSKNVLLDQDGHQPDWGLSCSPLVMGDKVIVSTLNPNHGLAAYSLQTGEKLWRGGDFGSDYSSPIQATLLGETQVLNFDPGGVTAHDPNTGAMRWHYVWPGAHPHVTPPRAVDESRVLISTGYGTGCELIQLSTNTAGSWKPTRLWKSMGLKSKFSPFVVYQGFIYGLDDGIFTCLDLATGERKWKDGRYGHGQFLLVQDLILLMAEKGEAVLIQPDPTALKELATLKLFSAKTWNPPALAGEYLLARNDREAVCYRIPILKDKPLPTTAPAK